jgi:thiol-disulfide isomerase/thioredoxin
MSLPPASRRDVILALGAGMTLLATPALAAGQAARVEAHPGFSAWTAVPKRRGPLPLDQSVKTPDGEMSLKAWLGGHPAVVILWASWCGPCFGDKPFQLKMQRKLEAAGSRTRIVLIQCFDPDVDQAQLDWRLKRLGVTELHSVRAGPGMEKGLRRWFGASPVDRRRTSLPGLALVGGDGEALGYCEGRPFTLDDKEWWSEPSAFDLLASLT